MLYSGLAALLLTSSGPAVAAEPPKEKKVCKRVYEMPLGSHIPVSTRTCLTKHEWKQLERENEDSARAVTDQRKIDPDEPSAGPGSSTPQ